MCLGSKAAFNPTNRCGLQVHYVYVDEVQDLTPAQIAILRFICANVDDGYVLAGDTAQVRSL